METKSEPVVLTDEVANEYLDVALAETFSRPGTADVTPEDRKKLSGLLKFYAKKAHPFTACKRDQLKHGLSEDHANRRCSVLKSLIKGGAKYSGAGKSKADLSEEELAEYALDADEEFFTWLSETDADAIIREAEEQQEKVGIVHRLSRFLGLEEGGLPDADTEEVPVDPEVVEEVKEGEHEVDANNERNKLGREAGTGTQVDVQSSSTHEPSDAADKSEAVRDNSSALGLAYQLPYDLSEPEKISRRLWRKHLLPLGKKINYTRNGVKQVLDFSKETLEKMADNFRAGAFDKIYFTTHHPKPGSDASESSRGVVRDIFLKDDGLYADIEVSEEGERLLANSLNEMGTSVSYHQNYRRDADDTVFGPAIQHIAATPTPHVPGLKPWEAVQMSELEAEVVDLTDAEYAAPDRKESGPVEVETQTETNEEVEMEQETQQPTISLEEFNALKAELEAERNDRQGIKSTLRNQGINGMLNAMVADKKTTPPKAEAAKVILSALQGAESDVIELSGDGAASVKDDEIGKAVLELLAPGQVPETGERGTTDLESRADMDEDQKIDLEIKEYRAEHPDASYDKAFEVVLARREG